MEWGRFPGLQEPEKNLIIFYILQDLDLDLEPGWRSESPGERGYGRSTHTHTAQSVALRQPAAAAASVETPVRRSFHREGEFGIPFFPDGSSLFQGAPKAIAFQFVSACVFLVHIGIVY